MREVFFSERFITDLGRIRKTARERAEILKTISLLAETNGKPPPGLREHRLSGGFSGSFACRVFPWLLLIYKRTPETLTMIAAGSYAQLFRS